MRASADLARSARGAPSALAGNLAAGTPDDYNKKPLRGQASGRDGRQARQRRARPVVAAGGLLLKERGLNFSTVLIISYHFYPSGAIGARRLTALARYLAGLGIRVVVVSAFGNETITHGCEIQPGVIAIPVRRPERLWLDLMVALKRRMLARRSTEAVATAAGSGSSAGAGAGRATSWRTRLRERYFQLVYFVDEYKKWARQAAWAAVRAGREYNATVVIASGPPHSALLAGAWAGRRLGIPYVADFRDPWSDVLAVNHPERGVELKLLRRLEGRVIRGAGAVTSTAEVVASILARRYPSPAAGIHVIRNGFDGSVAPPLTRTGGRLSILFAGVLYVRRTPYPLLAALEELLSRPDVDPTRIRVTFMGGKIGDFSDQALRGWLEGKRCAAVVRILPAQDPQAVAQEVAQATVLLNLAQQQQLHVPAKTYEQLAAGREVLVICEDDCETAGIVTGIRGVIQVGQSDPQVLIRVLLDLYQRHVIEGTPRVPAEAEVRQFSRTLANQRFHAVLTSVAALHGVGSASGAASAHGLMRQFIADARFYQQLVGNGRGRPGWLARTLLCNRGLWLLTFHRIEHFCVHQRNLRAPFWWCTRVVKSVGTVFSVVVCRSAFSEDCEIRGPAYLSNGGYLICGARSIGAGSLIHDRCTFGYAVARRDEGRPVIGRDVWIGPDCIIGGAITVGDGATILPGSFLTYSVPAGAVVQGNPAAIVRRDFDNRALRSSLAIVRDVVPTVA
jgi:serine acetyltransferase